jgi:hypothetical protein
MPQVIQGYLVNIKPSDTTAESTYVSDIIPAGAGATTIHYPSQYRSYAISAAIKNQDPGNTSSFSINGQPTITLGAGADQNINNQSIVSIQVTPGAAGTCDILAQVSPIYVTTEAKRFSTERG